MGFNRCLICYTEVVASRTTESFVTPGEEGHEEEHLAPDSSPESSISLEDNLHNIFVLKGLFEIPSEKLESYLAENGNPSEWSFIRFCHRCQKAVENLKRIYQQIVEASRLFTVVRGEVVERVRRSWRRFEGETPCRRTDSGGQQESSTWQCDGEANSRKIVEETRQFICEHDYGTVTDPFRDGDLLANALCFSTLDEITPVSDEEHNDNEDAIELEDDSNNHVDVYEEEYMDHVESDEEEWGHEEGNSFDPEPNTSSLNERLYLPNDMLMVDIKPIPNLLPLAPNPPQVVNKIKQKNVQTCSSSSQQRSKQVSTEPTRNDIFIPSLPIQALGAAQVQVHKCEYPGCNRVFTKRSHFNTHKRRHTGEKPFSCTWPGCDWKFTRKDELTRHYRTHTGDKPYKCPICMKDFMRSDHWRKHVSSVHKDLLQDMDRTMNSNHVEVEGINFVQ